MAAYRDHGQPAVRIDQDEPPAQALVAALTRLGIDLEQVAEQLEQEGVLKFVEAHDRLLAALAARCGG